MDEDYARRVIADHFGVPFEEVNSHSLFTRDLGADSLDLVELTLRLESEFNVHIDDAEVETCRDVGGALRILRQLVAEADQPMPRNYTPFSSTSSR